MAAADIVQSRDCSQIGLEIDSNGLEHLYWWALEVPQSGIRAENPNPFPEAVSYRDPVYELCAIICTLCTDREEYNGLPMITDFSGVRESGTDGE